MAGPSPKTLIDPVQPDDLERAALATLREWWAPMLSDPSRLQSREYQAYATLTMCRALYTIQYGTVATKTVAALRAQETVGERWTALIERALAWPHGAQSDSLNETLDFIRYTLERSEVLSMNRVEAKQLLDQFLLELQTRSYEDLKGLLSNPQVEEVESESGVRYQIEYEALWDREAGAELRIIASIDDGGLISSFFPVTSDFIITPTGEIPS
jgi:hypothetical protein